MELSSQKELKALFKKYEFYPRRERGQNFLVDRRALKAIVDAADITPDDWVVEVGAGAGVLTRELASRCRGLLTAELDGDLTRILAETIGKTRNVKIFKGDVMSREFFLETEKWKEKNGIATFKIVANLPYQITSIFLRNFLPRQDVSLVVLMVQKEVAQRMVAPVGETSLLSLSVQFYSKPKVMRTVSKNSFLPAPEIDSAIIRLDPADSFKKRNQIDDKTEEEFFKIMRMGFAARRKQLHNNLAGGLGLESSRVKDILAQLGLKEEVRAQELTLDDWFKLFTLLNS